MSILLRICPGNACALLIANVLVQVTVVILAAWLLARLAGRWNAASRHTIYLLALVCVLASPVLSLVMQAAGIALVTLRPSAPTASPAKTAHIPAAQLPESSHGEAAPAPQAAPTREPVEAESLGQDLRPEIRPGYSYPDVLRAVGGSAVLVWLLGMAFLLARWCYGLRLIGALRRTTQPIDANAIPELLHQVRRSLGTDRLPPMATSPDSDRPIMVGLLRPLVILPEDVLQTLPARELADILVHECAHAICRHHIVGFLQRLAGILFWPHPLVHVLNRELARAREEVCDNYVLRNGDAPRYARTLLELSQLLVGVSPKPAALGLFHCPWRLEDRVSDLLDRRRKAVTRVSRWIVAVTTATFLISGLLIAGIQVVRAEPSGGNERVVSLWTQEPNDGGRSESSGRVQPPARGETPQPNRDNGLAKSPVAERVTAAANVVRGNVTDKGGKPVVGADVWLPLWLYGIGVVQTLHATTDSQGRFVLEVPSAWCAKAQWWERGLILWAYAAGHCLGMGKVVLPGDALDVAIQLGPESDTAFVVLDPKGQPLPGALVEPFQIRTWLAIDIVPDELLARIGAHTDADGRAKIPSVAPDLLYQVRVTAKDLGVQFQRTMEAPGQPIQLRPVGKIEGRVIADQPETARGIRLGLTSNDHSGSWPAQATEGFADIKSDENGRFVVPAIAIGGVRISALVDEKQPLRPKLPESLSVQAGQTTSLEIPMVPTVAVRGSVRVKGTGKPVPGALIHIYYGVLHQGANAVSDAQGQYTARVLPGSIRLQMIAKPIGYAGYAWFDGDASSSPSEPTYQVPENAKEFDIPPIELETTKGISGHVVDQRGQPVGNIWIVVVEGDRRYGRGKSDKNGQFEVAGVPVTIDPANAKYAWLPGVGPRPFFSTKLSQCEILKSNPLTVRALPRDPRLDQP